MIFKFMESDAALWANHLSLSGSPHIEFQSFRVSNYKPYIPHWTTSAFSICRPMRGGCNGGEGQRKGEERGKLFRGSGRQHRVNDDQMKYGKGP